MIYDMTFDETTDEERQKISNLKEQPNEKKNYNRPDQ